MEMIMRSSDYDDLDRFKEDTLSLLVKEVAKLKRELKRIKEELLNSRCELD